MSGKQQDEYRFKIVLSGDAKVGKSQVYKRHASSLFDSDYEMTVGADFFSRKQSVFGKNVRQQVWDIAGGAAFRSLVPMYYRGADAVVLMFDLTNEESFENIKGYLRDADLYPEASVFLVGSKLDLVAARKVNEETIKKFVEDKSNNIANYFLVSAKTGEGINEMFSTITENFIIKKYAKNNNQAELVRLLFSNNSSSNPTPKEVLVARLEKYIKRIESYSDYRNGFWFDKRTRAQNRQANEELARDLLKALNESDGSVYAINAVFQDINQKRAEIIKNLNLDTKGRGINSAELSQVIERAGYFVKHGF